MQKEPAKLVEACNSLKAGGMDFPTIWKTAIKSHPEVMGIPVQEVGARGPVLKVSLYGGIAIIFEDNQFSLRGPQA